MLLFTAGLAMNSSVTSAALNAAVGSNVTAIDSSSGGAVLVNSSRITADVDDNTVLLSGMFTAVSISEVFGLVLVPNPPDNANARHLSRIVVLCN